MRDELFCLSLAGCSLAETKEKDNWVEKRPQGSLPEYICRISRAVKRSGHPTSQAIAIAVGRVKAWARGEGDVTAKTRAKAAKAVAEWEALKGATSLSNEQIARFDTDGDTQVLSLCGHDFSVDEARKAYLNQARGNIGEDTLSPAGVPEPWVSEVWNNFLIVELGDELLRVNFEANIDGTFEFEEPVRLKKAYIPIDEIADETLEKMISDDNDEDDDKD